MDIIGCLGRVRIALGLYDCVQIIKVSSTYLRYSLGFRGAVSRAFCSNVSSELYKDLRGCWSDVGHKQEAVDRDLWEAGTCSWLGPESTCLGIVVACGRNRRRKTKFPPGVCWGIYIGGSNFYKDLGGGGLTEAAKDITLMVMHRW